MNTTAIAILGDTAAFLTTFSFAIQVIKIIKTKSTAGISAFMYAGFVSGVVLWIFYGALTKDIPIFIGNTLTFLLAAPVLYWVVRDQLKNQKK